MVTPAQAILSAEAKIKVEAQIGSHCIVGRMPVCLPQEESCTAQSIVTYLGFQ